MPLVIESWGRRTLPALLLVVLCGCAGSQVLRQSLPDPDFVAELTDTPFFAQEDYQCGPAALATLLQASGVRTTPSDLVPTVFTPGRRGSLQVDLLAATRAAGRIPYELNGTLADIAGELRAGRPIVVLQNLGVQLIPRWHYAVVIGLNVSDDTVVLRSGTDRRRVMPAKLFVKTWARGDYWAFTALRPGELPANVERDRYVAAVAGLDEIGQAESAALAWQAALIRWPDDVVARFGLGNALLATRRFDAAEQQYRQLLAATPALAAVRNNLAVTLLEQGRLDEALLEVERALVQADDADLAEELRDTRRQIQDALERSGQ